MSTRSYVSSVRTAAAAAKRDPVIQAAAGARPAHGGLARVVQFLCAFWNRAPAIGRLHQAMPTAPEFAQALLERNERRRKALNILVRRIAAKTAPPRVRREAVDLIFALTSFAMFAMLSQDRSADEVRALVKSACRSALAPLWSVTRPPVSVKNRFSIDD